MTATRHAASDVNLRVRDDPAVNGPEQLAQEWPARAFFGVLLAGIAIAATIAGGVYFAALLALIALAASREWHRMAGATHYALETVLTACSIAASLAVGTVAPHVLWSAAALAAGAVLAGVAGRQRGAPFWWSAGGAVYIGVPALSLLALRMQTPHGLLVVLGVFITVWAADTGAFVWGRLLGGPKLVPTLSPNKTWSGAVGGVILPAALLSICVAYLGGNAWSAALLAAVLAMTGHTGDLFESWLKRRAGRKNSGGLIPGHGGVLDRIDSILFVAPLAAALVFVIGLDPLFGAHP